MFQENPNISRFMNMSPLAYGFVFLLLTALGAAWHLAETLRGPYRSGLKTLAAGAFAFAFLPPLHLLLTRGEQPLQTFMVLVGYGLCQSLISILRPAFLRNG